MPALLLVSYSGILGGAERVLLECAAAVPGHHVLACPEGELAAAARAAGLGVLALPQRSLRLRPPGTTDPADERGPGREQGPAGARLRVAAGAAAGLADHARELHRLAADLAPELIVASGMRPALACAAARPAAPWAFLHHDLLPGPAVGAAVRTAAARAAVVVAVSHAVAHDLDPRGRLAGRLHVVHPGIDPGRFAAAGPPGPSPEVLVLGALAEWKRPELALEICALARRRLPELRLRLVGGPIEAGDPTPARLRERAGAPDLTGAVELAGPVADPTPALARAACLLHCAEREPFGLVVLEAMASGRAVIAPAAGGPAEIVDHTCGRLYPPGDAVAAAGALVEVLSTAGLAANLGAAGRRRAAEHFGAERARAGFAAALQGPRATRGPRRRNPAAGRPPRPPRPARPAADAQQLSLLTVTHNSAPVLGALLESAARHLPGAPVIVVDCASSDGSLELALRHPGVTALDAGANLGFGRACNRGLAAVHTPLTALLNPDVELIDDSLLALAAEAWRPGAGPRLLAPLVLNPDGTRQDTAHPVPASAADLIRAIIPPGLVPSPAGVALAPWRARRPQRVGWAVGCALVARTATLRELGPFHPSIFMYGEDLELGLRARRSGVETWFWPAARVVHHGAHASRAAFGGEPFARLAAARHHAVAGALGSRRARVDDRAQAVTFASRLALKRALGRPAERERRQLEAVRSLRRAGGA